MTYLRKFFLAISATAALSLGAGIASASGDHNNNDSGGYGKCKPGYVENDAHQCVKKK